MDVKVLRSVVVPLEEVSYIVHVTIVPLCLLPLCLLPALTSVSVAIGHYILLNVFKSKFLNVCFLN